MKHICTLEFYFWTHKTRYDYCGPGGDLVVEQLTVVQEVVRSNSTYTYRRNWFLSCVRSSDLLSQFGKNYYRLSIAGVLYVRPGLNIRMYDFADCLWSVIALAFQKNTQCARCKHYAHKHRMCQTRRTIPSMITRDMITQTIKAGDYRCCIALNGRSTGPDDFRTMQNSSD